MLVNFLQLLEALDDAADADLTEKVDIVAENVAEKLDAPLSEVETQLWKFFHRFIITGK